MATSNASNDGTDSGHSWWYWGNRLYPAVALTPLRIAIAYAALGMLALYGSDVLLGQYLSDPLLGRVQAVKGGVEVVLTAGFVFAATRWRESQLRRTMDRLDRQREELQVLHRVLRHNLRNDLNVIQGYADMLAAERDEEDIDDRCQHILDTVDNMTRYTDQANRIKRLTQQSEEVRTYDLTQLVPRIVTNLSDVTDGVDVTTDVPEQATVEANPLFEEALAELIENAVEHNDAAEPAVSIEVRPDSGPSHLLEVRIEDNGPGIPGRELDPLEAGAENQLLHLSGMGLWFVEWTTRHSGGRLHFEDREGGGTTAIVQVPKAPEMLSPSITPPPVAA